MRTLPSVRTLQKGSVPTQLTVVAKVGVEMMEKDKATSRFFMETPLGVVKR
jgi:hypothetical protein